MRTTTRPAICEYKFLMCPHPLAANVNAAAPPAIAHPLNKVSNPFSQIKHHRHRHGPTAQPKHRRVKTIQVPPQDSRTRSAVSGSPGVRYWPLGVGHYAPLAVGRWPLANIVPWRCLSVDCGQPQSQTYRSSNLILYRLKKSRYSS